MDDDTLRPYRLTTTRALGDIIVYTDPDTPTGKNWFGTAEGDA